LEKETLSEEALRMKKERIIQVAAQLFLNDGLDNIRMTDIAEASGIGVASLYRYFETRTAIVIAAGTVLWKDIQLQFTDYFSSVRDRTGLEMVSEQFRFMLKLYHERPDFIRFLDSFDRLVLAEKVPTSILAEYEKSILNLKDLFLSTCKTGVKDGSIRHGLDYEKLYMTAAHAMNALAEKTARGPILEGDDFANIDEEPSMILELLLYYLRT
jgi:AcrR family transcriptional regulator